MNRDILQTWTQAFGTAWINRDVDAVMQLIDRGDIRYYESVFSPPCTRRDDVKKLWDVVPQNQKDITFDFQIVACSDIYGIVNWQVTRTLLPSGEKQEIDGIFQIGLNDKGLCTFFKQWRSVK